MGWTPGEGDDWRKDYSRAHARAKKLRADETPSEKKLWKILRTLKHEGAHFRRQCQVGHFVYDFACLSQRLLIELDGAVHDDAEVRARDLRKTADAERRGYRVLRLQNAEVEYPERVIDQVRVCLMAPHPCPSPKGEG
jgi:very-short-patch-repair endonuclease